MRTGRYANVPTSWLRVFLAGTDNAFGHAVLRTQRLEMANELTQRVIEEEAEATGSWPSLPVDGEN